MPDFAAGSGRRHELRHPPALLPQYLRAGLPRWGARPDAAPDTVLRLTGLRPRPADVARYAAVVGEPASDRLPLLYPHLLGFGLQLRLMTDPSFPFPPLGLVQVTNEVTALRRLPLAAVLEVAVHAGAVRSHPRGRVVELITQVHSGGELVWSETSSYLRRGRAAASAGVAANPTQATVPADPPVHFSARWRLGADLGRRYAAVSGDVNPIHLSALTARPLGFPRAIAHGMWTAAAVVGALQGRLPDALRYTVQFRRPISLPATVRLFTAVESRPVAAQVRGGEDDRIHLVGEIHEL